MTPTKKPSRRPFDATESFPDFLGHIGQSSETSFPKFPSVKEILQHQAGTIQHPLLLTETPPPSKPTSIFKGLLGGSADHLMLDAFDHPELYDEQTRQLIADLGAGARTVSTLKPTELEILDRATLAFASGQRPARTAPAQKPQPPVKRPRLMEAANELTDGRAPQVDIPGDPMSAYWWV
jgi:hypothetical protein